MKAKFAEMSSYTAYAAGITSLAYAYFFVFAKDVTISSLFLLITGLLATEVFIALFAKLKDVDEDFARIVMILGIFGSMGAAIHAGYDLANAINPPAVVNADLPNQVDPRGLLAFGVTGLAVLKASWLMTKSNFFPKNLAMLGFVSGALLVLIYVARLTILNPAHPTLLYPVLLEGFIVAPAWYLWLGSVLKKNG